MVLIKWCAGVCVLVYGRIVDAILSSPPSFSGHAAPSFHSSLSNSRSKNMRFFGLTNPVEFLQHTSFSWGSFVTKVELLVVRSSMSHSTNRFNTIFLFQASSN